MSLLAKVKSSIKEKANDVVEGGKFYHKRIVRSATHTGDDGGKTWYRRGTRVHQDGLSSIDAIGGTMRGTDVHRQLIIEGVLTADTWPTDVPWEVEPQATVVDGIVVPSTTETQPEIIPHSVVVEAMTNELNAAHATDPTEAEIARLLAAQAETETAVKNINSTASDTPANPVLPKEVISRVRTITRTHAKDNDQK